MKREVYGGVLTACNKLLRNNKGKRKFITQKIGNDTVSFIKGTKTLTIRKINNKEPTIESFYRVKGLLEAIHGNQGQWATFNI